MNQSPEESSYQVRMETQQWLIIDATIDNEVNVEIEFGDPRSVVDLGASIRQAGWDQNPGWPQDVNGFETWPAPGQQSIMTLSRSQWALVLSALERWAAVSENRSDQVGIAAVVRAQLAAQGWPQGESKAH